MIPRWLKSTLAAVLLLVVLGGCKGGLIERPEGPREALVEVEEDQIPFLRDDLSYLALQEALSRSITYLKTIRPAHLFSFGSDRVSAKELLWTLESFSERLKVSRSPKEFNRWVASAFRFYKAAGRDGRGSVLFTGYFEPVFHGSLRRHGPYRYPVYRRPEDLIEVDLGAFNKRLSGERIVGRIQGRSLIPYFTRSHIDLEGALEGKGLEIAWLKDPLDLYFLQIQGSGEILLEDGKRLEVCYDASNGHPYTSIGRFLVEDGKIAEGSISMQNIRAYLGAHPEKLASILSRNDRYIFFRVVKEGPIGALGLPLTPMRTIATDWRLFPKGALVFARTAKPLVDDSGRISSWVPFSAYVLNQDTGSGIKGPGRADLFWGKGRYAEIAAGHMRQPGELYFLVKKHPRPELQAD